MIPGSFSLNIYRGDTHGWQFLLWADLARTEPIDLATMLVKAEVRDRPGGPVIVPMAVTVTLPNTIEVGLDAATTGICPATGRWDLQLTDTSGQVATVLAGAVNVIGDVTDSTRAATSARTSGHLAEPVG